MFGCGWIFRKYWSCKMDETKENKSCAATAPQECPVCSTLPHPEVKLSAGSMVVKCPRCGRKV